MVGYTATNGGLFSEYSHGELGNPQAYQYDYISKKNANDYSYEVYSVSRLA